MNVNLGPVLDQFVADLLKSGRYQNKSEILRDGLRMLEKKELLRQYRRPAASRRPADGATHASNGK